MKWLSISLLLLRLMAQDGFAQKADALMPRCVEPSVCTKSVADFGAIGDGKTNDHPAIRAALRSLQSNDVLCFEEDRTYIVSGGLQVFGGLANDWTLYGRGATLKMADRVPTTPSTYILRVRESTGWMINDLQFDGNRDNRQIGSNAQPNLSIRGGSKFAVCSVTSMNSVRDGFYVYGAVSVDPDTFSEDGTFDNCVADNAYRNGMSVINARNLSIIGGEYRNTTGIAPQAGIDIEPNVGSFEPGVEGVTVRDASFHGNGGYGLVISSKGIPARIQVERNRFLQNRLGGVFVGGSHIDVTNNLFHDFQQPSGRGVIHLRLASGTEETVISNNTLANIDTTKPVIWVSSGVAAGHKILNNCIEDFTGPEAIQAPAASGLTLAGNVVNPPAGCLNPLDPTAGGDRSPVRSRQRRLVPKAP